MTKNLLISFLIIISFLLYGVPSPKADNHQISWIFDNNGLLSYTLESVTPVSTNLGMIGTENPDLTLEIGTRYQVTVTNYASHPFQFIAKGTTATQDTILLSMNSEGSFESDQEVNWSDNRAGTVDFTMTMALYNKALTLNRAPGYRCGIHTTTMRGDFIVASPGKTDGAGDISGDQQVDLEDAILALQVITAQNTDGIRDDYVSAGVDINGDHKVGQQEAIYILQKNISFTGELSLVFMPGSQPESTGTFARVSSCGCHRGSDSSFPNDVPDGIKETPFESWKGSMMANAARDPIFWALLAVENKLFAQRGIAIGDYCLRCHVPKGWLEGRSEPADGSAFVTDDFDGVQCDVCHRMVDPLSIEGQGLINPPVDINRNAQFILSPNQADRRGPYDNSIDFFNHTTKKSDFHLSSEFCATCHEITNPYYGNHVMVEKTYTEWKNSAYANANGPDFKSCQECHMPLAGGYAANPNIGLGNPLRDNIGLHEFIGGNAWAPFAVVEFLQLDNDPTNNTAFTAADAQITRDLAIQQLQSAAQIVVTMVSNSLEVTITNLTGHKLPTGYTEGRRMWINVKFFSGTTLISESGAYDPATGILTEDGEIKVYEAKPGVKGIDGFEDGPSFHFALNNHTFKDNRIPPKGFTNAAFEANGAYIVGTTYADGQDWDTTTYTIPSGATRAEVRLYYQSTSKEFIEFLRDENINNPFDTNEAGQLMYTIWENTDKAAPIEMNTVTLSIP